MATKYSNSADFQAYCDARGLVPVTGDKDKALLIASEWLDARYVSFWLSTGTYKTGGRVQEREWPRSGYVDMYGYAVDSSAVPREIINATHEAALRVLANPAALNTDFKASDTYKSVSVDGAISVTYNSNNSAEDFQLVIPIIDGILAPLLQSPFGSRSSSLSGSSVRV